MIYKSFDKKSRHTTTHAGIGTVFKDQQLANELKSITRKLKKGKVYSPFKNKIWNANLADTQLISKYNEG